MTIMQREPGTIFYGYKALYVIIGKLDKEMYTILAVFFSDSSTKFTVRKMIDYEVEEKIKSWS